jgi:predicted DNA-binding transcriptional regulator AlpA
MWGRRRTIRKDHEPISRREETNMPEFIDVNQLAERMAVDPNTIRKWVREKRLPQPIRMTRKWSRWPASVLEDFFKTAATV